MKNAALSVKPPSVIQIVMFSFLIVAGVVLVFCSLYIDPKGEIHPTVIATFGMILTFVGTGLGIDYNYKLKYFRDIDSFLSNQKQKKKSPKDAPI